MNDVGAVSYELGADRQIVLGFDELFAAHHERLLRLAILVGGDRAAAEDAVADVFARLLRRGHRGVAEASDPVAYLNRAVVNELRGAARRAHRRSRRPWPAELPTPSDFASGLEERDRVMRALAALNHRQRAVIVLRFYEDLTEPAIARQLDMPLGTVKSILSRAMPILRQQLKDTP